MRYILNHLNLYADEVSRDRRVAALNISILIYLMASFIRFIVEPGHLMRVSAEGRLALLNAPAPWLPQFVSQNPLSNYVILNLSAISLLILIVGAVGTILNWHRMTLCLLALCGLFRFYLYGMNVSEFENFDHVFFLVLFVFIFFQSRVTSILFVICLMYWCSCIVKISPSWLNGSVFTSVPGGELPLSFGKPPLIKVMCWSLILIELLFPFLFFSRRIGLRRLAWWTFLGFHIYSFFIIGYRFPLLMLGLLVPLYPLKSEKPLVVGKMSAGIIAFGVCVLLISQYHFLIPGPRIVTQEGRLLGLFLYDANVSCRIKVEFDFENDHVTIEGDHYYRRGVIYADGTSKFKDNLSVKVAQPREEDKWIFPDRSGVFTWAEKPIYNRFLACSSTKRVCCDPYVFYGYVSQLRKNESISHVQVNLAVDINGHQKWATTVDEKDFIPEVLGYSFTRHNNWIRLPPKDFPADYIWP
jgi:hypothetical protein